MSQWVCSEEVFHALLEVERAVRRYCGPDCGRIHFEKYAEDCRKCGMHDALTALDAVRRGLRGEEVGE